MKKTIISTFILSIIGYISYCQTGYEIMEKNKLQLESESAEYDNMMTLFNKRGQKRVRSVKRYEITDGDNNKSMLLQFTYPADVEGTSLLTIEKKDKEDDRWLYLPALKLSRRIPSADISKSFMGTDFTYEDLENDDIEQFTYVNKGSEKVNNYDCYIVEASPKTEEKKKETGYSKRLLYITKDHYIIIRVRYFDKSNTEFKTFLGEDIKRIEGSDKWRMHKMTMNNNVRGSKTMIEVKNYKLNERIDPAYFTKRHIESFNN